MNDKDSRIIQKIIQRINTALLYCEGKSFEIFNTNTMLQEACVFNLLQVGELANHISDEIINSYPGIPWRQMIGLRNRLVHDYDGIRLKIVWETITDDFPILREMLEKL